jgi:hypothetical protein
MMGLDLFQIHEWPYGRTVWAKFPEACTFAQVESERLRRICATIGARIIDYHGQTLVDFGVLGRSSSWRMLLDSRKASDSQGDLFAAECHP